MMRLVIYITLIFGALFPSVNAATECSKSDIKLQILGSRGPELLDENASTGYLIWINDKARILIDAGPGSLQRFKQAKADFADLDIILISHFHADHSAELIHYIKAAQFTQRTEDLVVAGPSGSDFSASLSEFLDRSFNVKDGLYPYLANYISDEYNSKFKIKPLERFWTYEDLSTQQLFANSNYEITSVATHHGAYPSLGYRVQVDNCVIAFTGDMSGRLGAMPDLAKGADILVAHLAIEQSAEGLPQILHMKPSYIAEMASDAEVKHLVLGHFMSRSLKHLDESLEIIRKQYKGKITLAEDLLKLTP